MKLRFNILAILIGTISATPTFANDDNWSGPYVGIFGGVNDGTTIAQDYWCWSACSSVVLDNVDLAGGATVGFNEQVDDNLLIGLEADFGNGSKRVREVRRTPTSVPDYIWKSDLKWQSTLRARAGLVVGKTVVYATGGVAFAKADFSEASDGSRSHGSNSTEDWGARWRGTAKGYTYGAGVEHAIGNFSAKLEFLRSNFGSRQSCYMDLAGPNAGACWDPAANNWNGESTVTFTPTVSSVRIGVNYRF